MSSDRTAIHLKHMLDNIDRILEWTRASTLDSYKSSPMLRDAVERCLERVSEASRRIPAELKATEPRVPWRKVADIGNVLRHEYHDVGDAEVWRIVVDDLQSLKDAVLRMIDRS